MTTIEFLANPMAPVVIALFIVMIGGCIALALQDSEPTPEYTRLMAEHNARMATWEAGKPERMAQYAAESAARREAIRLEWAERSAARQTTVKGE